MTNGHESKSSTAFAGLAGLLRMEPDISSQSDGVESGNERKSLRRELKPYTLFSALSPLQ